MDQTNPWGNPAQDATSCKRCRQLQYLLGQLRHHSVNLHHHCSGLQHTTAENQLDKKKQAAERQQWQAKSHRQDQQIQRSKWEIQRLQGQVQRSRLIIASDQRQIMQALKSIQQSQSEKQYFRQQLSTRQKQLISLEADRNQLIRQAEGLSVCKMQLQTQLKNIHTVLQKVTQQNKEALRINKRLQDQTVRLKLMLSRKQTQYNQSVILQARVKRGQDDNKFISRQFEDRLQQCTEALTQQRQQTLILLQKLQQLDAVIKSSTKQNQQLQQQLRVRQQLSQQTNFNCKLLKERIQQLQLQVLQGKLRQLTQISTLNQNSTFQLLRQQNKKLSVENRVLNQKLAASIDALADGKAEQVLFKVKQESQRQILSLIEQREQAKHALKLLQTKFANTLSQNSRLQAQLNIARSQQQDKQNRDQNRGAYEVLQSEYNRLKGEYCRAIDGFQLQIHKLQTALGNPSRESALLQQRIEDLSATIQQIEVGKQREAQLESQLEQLRTGFERLESELFESREKVRVLERERTEWLMGYQQWRDQVNYFVVGRVGGRQQQQVAALGQDTQ